MLDKRAYCNLWDRHIFINTTWLGEVHVLSTSLFGQMENTEKSAVADLNNAKQFLKGFGELFYIINPNTTSYSHVENVPNFVLNAWPYFLFFIILENILLWMNKKPTYRLNDSLTSLSIAIVSVTVRLTFRGAESYAYVYLYENYHFVDLPWNHPSTWYMAALGVDFCYYWMHRAAHEVHILWAQHQVHHSSEEFNMVVTLRHSVLHGWCGFIFYLPLAFAIPPAHFVTHQQFNLIFQFWVHTEVVKTLGPLEWIFNTPNHHRVHHGSNFYCLDKNYGGVLIIWDRIFGTFANPAPNEEIIYGLVVNQPSFNLLRLETFYTIYAYEKMNSMASWRYKLAAIFYGPSWQPNRPRLGAEEDIVKVGPREKYYVKLPMWCNAYIIIHFCLVIYIFQEFVILHAQMNPMTATCFICYIIGSLTVIGLLFDNSQYAANCELIRCGLLVFAIQVGVLTIEKKNVFGFCELFFGVSSFLWILKSFNVLQISTPDKNA
ncbi:alkylglycerol monooxygenase-like [Photinus pyralis]|nr:alkylglycerol monooxygenase-like [Photinus pyralis]